MKALQPSETLLTGTWLEKDGNVVADDVCRRIEWLVKFHLEQVSGSGWEILYRDLGDGRLWEHTYPHGDWHGGGPPQLKIIEPELAALKYHINSI